MLTTLLAVLVMGMANLSFSATNYPMCDEDVIFGQKMIEPLSVLYHIEIGRVPGVILPFKR